jgi:hypothetical protein
MLPWMEACENTNDHSIQVCPCLPHYFHFIMNHALVVVQYHLWMWMLLNGYDWWKTWNAPISCGFTRPINADRALFLHLLCWAYVSYQNQLLLADVVLQIRPLSIWYDVSIILKINITVTVFCFIITTLSVTLLHPKAKQYYCPARRDWCERWRKRTGSIWYECSKLQCSVSPYNMALRPCPYKNVSIVDVTKFPRAHNQ